MELHSVTEPVNAEGANLSGSAFVNVNLEAARFDDVNLGKSTFVNVSLKGATFTDVNLSDAAISNANLAGMTILDIPVADLLRVYRQAVRGQAAGALGDQTRALAVTEIKAFVPARDFATSKQFYQDVGFTLRSEGGGVAYFCFENASFLLQDFCADGLAENFMMHLLVKDVDAWWSRVEQSGVVEKYGVKTTPIVLQPWRMRDFCLTDPSGVLWRIGQNVP